MFANSRNAARSILPTIRRLKTGKPLPENLARIAAISDQEAEQLIADKDGLENMTGAEQAMLKFGRLRVKLLCFSYMN